MKKNLAIGILVLAALVSPGVVVALEWARTVMRLFQLSPGVPYMPNGFLQFYLIVAGAMLVIGVPASRGLIRLGELRPARYIRNALMIVIFWKIIDATMLSGDTLEGTESTLMLSIGTFGYGVIAGFVFWRIGVRPQRFTTTADSAGENGS